MTTYLPTILLIFTTYVTTFFKPQFFEAALGANLTTMLMMTTIFMTTLSELTDTAYAKWIDLWLIFCQLVPFVEVILLTLKEAYREKETDQDKIQRRRNRKKASQSSEQPWAISVVQPSTEERQAALQLGVIPKVVEEKTMQSTNVSKAKKGSINGQLVWIKYAGTHIILLVTLYYI